MDDAQCHPLKEALAAGVDTETKKFPKLSKKCKKLAKKYIKEIKSCFHHEMDGFVQGKFGIVRKTMKKMLKEVADDVMAYDEATDKEGASTDKIPEEPKRSPDETMIEFKVDLKCRKDAKTDEEKQVCCEKFCEDVVDNIGTAAGKCDITKCVADFAPKTPAPDAPKPATAGASARRAQLLQTDSTMALSVGVTDGTLPSDLDGAEMPNSSPQGAASPVTISGNAQSDTPVAAPGAKQTNAPSSSKDDDSSLGAGGIVGIVLGALAVVGIGGFAAVSSQKKGKAQFGDSSPDGELMQEAGGEATGSYSAGNANNL